MPTVVAFARRLTRRPRRPWPLPCLDSHPGTPRGAWGKRQSAGHGHAWGPDEGLPGLRSPGHEVMRCGIHGRIPIPYLKNGSDDDLMPASTDCNHQVLPGRQLPYPFPRQRGILLSSPQGERGSSSSSSGDALRGPFREPRATCSSTTASFSHLAFNVTPHTHSPPSIRPIHLCQGGQRAHASRGRRPSDRSAPSRLRLSQPKQQQQQQQQQRGTAASSTTAEGGPLMRS